MNLFIAKLSSTTTGDDLNEVFSAYGEVTSAKVIIDRQTGNSKGYGFVEMPNEDEAKSAIASLNNSELNGKTIVVKEANERPERPQAHQRPRGGFQRRDHGHGRNQQHGQRRFQNRDRQSGGGDNRNHYERW